MPRAARLSPADLCIPTLRPKPFTAEGWLFELKHDFAELQRRARMQRLQTIDDAAARRPAMLIVFDVLEAGGDDMRGLSLTERKAWLTANVSVRPRLRLIDGVETHGEALFAAISAQDFEGIVGKRLDSPYKAGRQPSWVKIKNPDYSRKEALGFR